MVAGRRRLCRRYAFKYRGNMKKISELEIGIPDAENYKRREFKELFNKLFVRDHFLNNLLAPEISFLIGEKY